MKHILLSNSASDKDSTICKPFGEIQLTEKLTECDKKNKGIFIHEFWLKYGASYIYNIWG